MYVCVKTLEFENFEIWWSYRFRLTDPKQWSWTTHEDKIKVLSSS